MAVEDLPFKKYTHNEKNVNLKEKHVLRKLNMIPENCFLENILDPIVTYLNEEINKSNAQFSKAPRCRGHIDKTELKAL